MARLVQADRKTTVAQVSTHYNGVIQKNNSECTCCALMQMTMADATLAT